MNATSFPLAKHLFAPLPTLGQPEMTSVNLENPVGTKLGG